MATEERKVEYTFEDLEPMDEVYVLNLSDLEEICTYKPKSNSDYRLVKCKPKKRDEEACPFCHAEGCTTIHGKASKPRYVHDISAGTVQIDLSVEVPRYRCKNCGGTFNHRFKSIPENRQFTDRLLDQIKRDSFIRPFDDVACNFGISAQIVGEIFDEYANELEKEREVPECPRVLGIDEDHIVNSMRGVFVDSENGTLLEMTPTNKEDDVIKTIKSFKNWDKNLQVVTIDMSCGYRAWLRKEFPDVSIVIDHFHVIKDLIRCCNSSKTLVTEIVNEQIAKETNPDAKEYHKELMRRLHNNPYLFKYNATKLAEKKERIQLFTEVCKEFPAFNHLRLLKETFELIYTCSDKVSAEMVFKEWTKLVPPVGKKQKEAWEEEYGLSSEPFDAFRSFKKAVEQYYDEIFQYFEPGCRVTNAAAEGCNNMISRVVRQGNGYSFERLRKKALLWHLASPKTQYCFRPAKKTVPKPEGQNKSTYGSKDYVSFMHFGNETITIDVTEVVIDRKKKTYVRRPLSVFMFSGESDEA